MKTRTETEQAMAAIKRAAKLARIRASRFGTKLAVWKDGSVIFIEPKADQGVAAEPDRAGG
ncbi:hypothetical protein AAFN60_04050 [Roseibacillus persicicus]|uniref:hypothetical protein n=1 Tax=Roseibacillus persicicus TaxID=454148 RepID=UPI00398A6D47